MIRREDCRFSLFRKDVIYSCFIAIYLFYWQKKYYFTTLFYLTFQNDHLNAHLHFQCQRTQRNDVTRDQPSEVKFFQDYGNRIHPPNT